MHKLAGWLAERQMTQEQFAELVGSTQGSVARWISGLRTPRPAQVRKIKEITGGQVTANDFMTDAAEEPEGEPPIRAECAQSASDKSGEPLAPHAPQAA